MSSQRTQPTILIVDDEKDLLKALADTLTTENFFVQTALTGREGLSAAEAFQPDVIILDIRLPDVSGYDVCRKLKENTRTAHIPIIMLSTRSKETEKVVGLELGADDYLTKPYNALELVARIRVILRRRQSKKIDEPEAAQEDPVIRTGPIEMNTVSRRVKVNDQEIKLTRKEFDLLALLAGSPEKVLRRQFILESVWGYEADSLQGTVDSHIKTLRKKMGEAGSLIETVTGVGFRLKSTEE